MSEDATLAILRTRLQQLGYGTDTATAQTSMINAAYRRLIGMRRWWFLEVVNNQALTCTAGTQSYDIDATVTDFLHIDGVRLEFSTTYLDPLKYLQPTAFFELAHLDRANAEPQYWTRVNDKLYLHPRPDKAYTIDLDYVKDPSALSADADKPVIPAAYRDILVWDAVRMIAFRERDTAGWSLANTQYLEVLGDMIRQDGLEQRRTAQEVVRTYELDEVNDSLVGGTPWPTY